MYRWQPLEFWLGSDCWCRGRAWHLKVLPVVIEQGWRPWLYLLIWSSAKPCLAPVKVLFRASSSAGSLAALLGEDKGNPVTLLAEFYQSGTSSCAGHDFCYFQHSTWEMLSIYADMCPLSLKRWPIFSFVHPECWRICGYLCSSCTLDIIQYFCWCKTGISACS